MKFLNLFKRNKPSVIVAEWTPAVQMSDCYIWPLIQAAFEAGKSGFGSIEVVRHDNPFSQGATFYFKAVSNAKP